VCRPRGDTDCEVREQGGDEVRSRMDGLGNEGEAMGGEADPELEQQEHRRGRDRDEGRPALWAHASSRSGQTTASWRSEKSTCSGTWGSGMGVNVLTSTLASPRCSPQSGWWSSARYTRPPSSV